MATPAQLAANRRNSTRSTGPRSQAGKQRSARNATSHGLSTASPLPAESAAQHRALLDTYRQQFHPANPHEHFLVDQMVHARWRLERIQRLELAYWTGHHGPDAAVLDRMAARSADVLAALNRYTAAAERSYYRAYKELQAARQNEANQRAQTAATDSDTAYARFLDAVHDAPAISFKPAPRPTITAEEKKNLALRL